MIIPEEKEWKEFENKYPLTSHRKSFEAGYSLSTEQLQQKDKEIAEYKADAKEIERLKGLILTQWNKNNNHIKTKNKEQTFQQFKQSNKL